MLYLRCACNHNIWSIGHHGRGQSSRFSRFMLSFRAVFILPASLSLYSFIYLSMSVWLCCFSFFYEKAAAIYTLSCTCPRVFGAPAPVTPPYIAKITFSLSYKSTLMFFSMRLFREIFFLHTFYLLVLPDCGTVSENV